jgi:type VI secretion system protein ImpG
MMARLRNEMDSEAGKLPHNLLYELEPTLVSATPSLAIMEAELDAQGTDVASGYPLKALQVLVPTGMKGDAAEVGRLSACRFSLPYKAELWPLRVVNIKKNSDEDSIRIASGFVQAKSSILIDIQNLSNAMVRAGDSSGPLQFFINSEPNAQAEIYDLLGSSVVGVVVSDESGNVVRKLSAESFSLSGFDDQQRLFSQVRCSELGVSLLKDFFSLREKFLFFGIEGLGALFFPDDKAPKENLKVQLILDCVLPNDLTLYRDTFKLNCFPVVNLFQKTTEPLSVDQKDYKYKLVANRTHESDFEVVSVDKVYAVDALGVRHEIHPYFAAQRQAKMDQKYYWSSTQEERHRKIPGGVDTFLSIFGRPNDGDDSAGLTVYSSALCCNRSLCESLKIGQNFNVVGTAPIKSLKLLTRPTRYVPPELNASVKWKLFSFLTRYHVSLCEPQVALETLKSFLSFQVKSNDLSDLKLLDSIENCETSEHPIPSQVGGWRGYHQGIKFKISLNEDKFRGSYMLFGRVLLQALALYCPINTYLVLELVVAERRLHQWPPMNGQMSLS